MLNSDLTLYVDTFKLNKDLIFQILNLSQQFDYKEKLDEGDMDWILN